MSGTSAGNGGWNVYFTVLEGLHNANPAANAAIGSGIPGWPASPELETPRGAWLDAVERASEKRISERIHL